MTGQHPSWSREQGEALTHIRTWLPTARTTGPQVCRIFGYAGTGKTQLAREITAMIEDEVLFAAYTGKASLVLSRRVGHPASTLHRLVYEPHEVVENGRSKTIWVLSADSPLKDAGLLVVDEVSMVNERMGRDLLSFGVPMLVLGDPFQLPPIHNSGFFTSGEPDAMLTEVHRHEGAVLDLATAIRQGEDWRAHPNVITHEPADLSTYDVIICGTHRTRHRVNQELRAGRGPDPEHGDKVLCIRNDYEVGLFNGQSFTVEGDPIAARESFTLELKGDDGEALTVQAPAEDFEANECQGFDGRNQTHRKMACLSWGYALTAHKSQGSQWDNVLVIDESSTFREPARWLYTAVTRAAENVTVVTSPLSSTSKPRDYWD